MIVAMLVLSVFPGIGLLDRAFELEGFCIVRGPDCLWGGDIRAFHPPAGKFDGVIGGVPCQFFSSLANLVRANGYEPRHGNLFPEYERVAREAEPAWFLCECVPAAPGPVVEGYAVHSFLWGNHWLGEAQMRTRRFWFGVRGDEAVDLRRWLPQAALELPVAIGAITQNVVNNSAEAKGRVQRLAVTSKAAERPVKIGGSGKVKTGCVTAAHQGRWHEPKALHGAVTGSDGGASVRMRRYRLPEACQLQGLPEDFLAEAPFTAQGKLQVVANGVPLPLGRALARAIKSALTKEGTGETTEGKRE